MVDHITFIWVIESKDSTAKSPGAILEQNYEWIIRGFTVRSSNTNVPQNHLNLRNRVHPNNTADTPESGRVS